MKMTSKQKTEAICKFAKAHGYSQSTVRTVSELRYQAYALNKWRTRLEATQS